MEDKRLVVDWLICQKAPQATPSLEGMIFSVSDTKNLMQAGQAASGSCYWAKMSQLEDHHAHR